MVDVEAIASSAGRRKITHRDTKNTCRYENVLRPVAYENLGAVSAAWYPRPGELDPKVGRVQGRKEARGCRCVMKV